MRIRRRGKLLGVQTPEQKKLQEEFQRRQMLRRCLEQGMAGAMSSLDSPEDLGYFQEVLTWHFAPALAREKEAGDAYRKSFEPASTRKRAQRPQPKKRGGTA